MLFAHVQSTQGQIVSSNEVVYPFAFKGIKANVVYKYTLAGLSQDVVLLEQLPSPATFGLSSNCVLQVLTEFTHAPTPVIRTAPARRQRPRRRRPMRPWIPWTLGQCG